MFERAVSYRFSRWCPLVKVLEHDLEPDKERIAE
jgi:hypothetical protein